MNVKLLDIVNNKIFTGDLKKEKFMKTFYMPFYNNPTVMIIMQNPGKIGEEKADLDSAKSIEECLDIYYKSLLKWFNGLDYFSPKFFRLINNYILKLDNDVSIEDMSKRIYFTGIIKSRKNIKVYENDRKEWFELILNEIKIIKPKVIFCFGRAAWQRFLKNRDKIYNYSYKKHKKKISKVHGDLFHLILADVGKIPLIPLVHMSARSFNPTIKDTYFDYLEKGLVKYREKINTKN